MESIDALLSECEVLHGHMCAGQLLGTRMALLGCSLIDIQEPRGKDKKKLIVWVEIDRCMADAISAVAGVRLGKRSLKYVDYGKVAATFLNTSTNEAVRVVALEESRDLANTRYPHIAEKRERQFLAYREASDKELFRIERVTVIVSEMDLPGSPRTRVICARCGEGINDGREVLVVREVLCRPCANGAYYQQNNSGNAEAK
jgi:formylmethanofuran dehydrogenase subunit E